MSKITEDGLVFQFDFIFDDIVTKWQHISTLLNHYTVNDQFTYQVKYYQNKIQFLFPLEVLNHEFAAMRAVIESKLHSNKKMLSDMLKNLQNVPDHITLIELAPTHVYITIDFGLAVCKFCITKFLGNSLFNINERNLKVFAIHTNCSPSIDAVLKQPPLNLHLIIPATVQLHLLSNLLYNTYIPMQLLQQVIGDELQYYINIFMTFVPTPEFGVLHFSMTKNHQSNTVFGYPHGQVYLQITTKTQPDCLIVRIREAKSYMALMGAPKQNEFNKFISLFDKSFRAEIKFQKLEDLYHYFAKIQYMGIIYVLFSNNPTLIEESRKIKEERLEEFWRILTQKAINLIYITQRVKNQEILNIIMKNYIILSVYRLVHESNNEGIKRVYKNILQKQDNLFQHAKMDTESMDAQKRIQNFILTITPSNGLIIDQQLERKRHTFQDQMYTQEHNGQVTYCGLIVDFNDWESIK